MFEKKKASRLGRAARAIVEQIEERLLFTALTPGSSVLVFNASTTGGASLADTLTLTNSGSTTLTFNAAGAFQIVADPNDSAGDESAQFAITSSTPTSLGAGQSTQITLDYSASVANTIQEALLQITPDGNSAVNVQLHGLGTTGQFGYNEPSLANIFTAFDIPTDTGETDPTNSQYPQTPSNSSQEVVIQRLVKAGTGPVTITPLASFDTNSSPSVRFGYYVPGDATDTTELFTIDAADAQTVNPVAQGASSFDPGSSEFGLYATFPGTSTSNNQPDTHYSEDALNTLDPSAPRKLRFFPMENPDGSVVPNTYVIAAEDYNDPTYNSFTNFVGIISNVTAAPGAPDGAALGLTNLSGAPSTTRLAFNRIQNKNPADPSNFTDLVHDTNTLQVTNTGNQTLDITGLSLSDTTNWQIVNPPSLPATVAPGGTMDIAVQFIATSNPPHTDNQTNDTTTVNGIPTVDAGGVWNGTLTISSNDAARPTRVIQLAGYWQYMSENENEPSLQTIINLLYGYSTTIANQQEPQYPDNGSQPAYYGEEEASAFWNVADPSLPVTVLQLDAFHNQFDPNNPGSEPAATTYWYSQGSGTLNELFQNEPGASQSLFPPENGSTTGLSQASFVPNGAFGWDLDGENSNDSANTTDLSYGRSGHAVRFWPLRDSNGNVVPNAWIMGMDYENSQYDNSDFQDNVYLVTNMRPAGVPAAATDLQAIALTNSVELLWQAAASGNPAGYNVFSASSADGPYTQLNSSLITGTSYSDTTAAAGSTVYYRVITVDASNDESRGIGTFVGTPTSTGPTDTLSQADINDTPAGSTTVITPGVAYNITAGGNDIGGSAADGFRYEYEQLTGDFDAIVQVQSVTQNVLPNSGAGLMARSTLDPGSEMVFSGASATDGYRFNYRSVADQVGTFNIVGTVSYPNVYVRLTRVGNVFTGYSSSDGVNWTQTGTVTLSLPTTLYLGMAVSSHTTSQTVTADLRGFNVTQSQQQPQVTAPAGLTGTADSSGITLQWDAETAAAGYNVSRSTSSSGPFTQLNSTLLTSPSYDDTSAPVGVISYYQVVAVDGSGNVSSPSTTSATRPATSTTMNFGGKIVATYTDSNGHSVTLRLTGPGSGQATFVNGDLNPDSITLSNTTAASVFTITAKGGMTTVGGITDGGSLGRIAALQTIVQGNIAIAGSVNSIQLAGDNGGTTISIGAGKVVPLLSLGQVADLSITSVPKIALLRVSSWTVNSATDPITAPSITSLISAGDFGASLNLNGSGRELGAATIRGALNTGPWSLLGSAGQIVAASVESGWSATISGSVPLFQTTGAFGGNLTVSSIGTFLAGGNDTGTVSTTAGSSRDIRVLTVRGAIAGGQFRTQGGIGMITAAAIVNANIFAGVASGVTALPNSAAEFSTSASISSVVVSGRSQPFAVQGSNVAAMTLGRVAFGSMDTDNNGTSFGLAAHSLTSYTRTINGQKLTWTNKMDPSLLAASGDATVNLV